MWCGSSAVTHGLSIGGFTPVAVVLRRIAVNCTLSNLLAATGVVWVISAGVHKSCRCLGVAIHWRY